MNQRHGHWPPNQTRSESLEEIWGVFSLRKIIFNICEQWTL